MPQTTFSIWSEISAKAGSCSQLTQLNQGGDGELATLRMLNGDRTRCGACCIVPNEEPDYGGFPICVAIPARTMVAGVDVYALEEEEEEEEEEGV